MDDVAFRKIVFVDKLVGDFAGICIFVSMDNAGKA